MKNDYSILGLCRKAGKLACGHDAVIEAIRNDSAKLVILTSDASVNHKKDVERLNFSGNMLTLTDTMETIYYAVGKKCCILAVTDDGFAKSVYKKLLDNQKGGQ